MITNELWIWRNAPEKEHGSFLNELLQYGANKPEGYREPGA